MCGIVGYIGNKNAARILLNGFTVWNTGGMTVQVWLWSTTVI